jgi:beta-glucanase (GH16 family)
MSGVPSTNGIPPVPRLPEGVSGVSTPRNPKLRQRKIFKSTVLNENEEVHKPWLESKARKSANRKAYWLFIMGIVIGLLAAVAVIYTGYASVKHYNFCLVLDESFSGDSINTNIWFHEQETGGFGNGEFEWTTDSTNNSYVKDGYLYIVPTLTSDALGMDAITNGYNLNLTTAGTCTAANPNDADSCSVYSNSSTGTILPPIQSARLVTNFSTTIKYGRVEVRAKMPKGDWIWPAVWMMPKYSVYGEWPRSGEIDIFESRGNVVKSKNDDFGQVMHSTLHWGPSTDYDGYKHTTDGKRLFRNYYNEDFHTVGMQWTPDGMYTYYDNPNNKVLEWKFDKSFWTLGDFPTASTNGSTLTDPWPAAGNDVAPFDQEFFLILNVAVGGTNGWFNTPDMPWSNDADNARAEFWENRDDWLPTWGTTDYDRGMVVDSVKMWNLEGVEGIQCPAAPITN